MQITAPDTLRLFSTLSVALLLHVIAVAGYISCPTTSCGVYDERSVCCICCAHHSHVAFAVVTLAYFPGACAGYATFGSAHHSP